MDVALLVLRVVFGLLLAGHGAQKLFGWFGGHGLGGTSAWLASLNLRPAPLWALAAGLSELAGGLLLTLGLLAPLGALAVIAAMVMAIVLAHLPNGLWASNGGIEFPLAIATVAAALLAGGPGRYSLDGALGIEVPATLTFVAAAAVALGVAMALLSRRPAVADSSPSGA